MILTLASFALALGILIAVHEFGHYWVGRKMGVHVLRYSIGFGPVLYSRRNKLGTEFSLSLLPLGGYVKFLDEREGDVAPELVSQAFNRQSIGARAAIVAAGPAANFLLAIALYAGLSMWGQPNLRPIINQPNEASMIASAGNAQRGDRVIAIDGTPVENWMDVQMALVKRVGESGTIDITLRPERGFQDVELSIAIERWLSGERDPNVLAEVGLQPWQPIIPAVVDEVVAGSPAEDAGIRPGDELITANGESLSDWQQWRSLFASSPSEAIEVGVQRVSGVDTVVLTPERLEDGSGRVGIAVLLPEEIAFPDGYRYTERLNPLQAVPYGVQQTWQLVTTSFDFLGKMLSGAVTPKNLSGPVSIAQLAGESASYGVISFITFLAFISVSLGVVNLLPLPVLDGGHLVLLALEKVRGQPMPEKFEQVWGTIGMFVLLSIMSFALFNDLDRLG
ncbi:RIP metalloprotease RseP [Salinibius halmophilus]|uniref:RIP metalloprotease RseP n=1 Tax=Salinibius halmophilus TaxID=1853216 RepID=UPI000E66B4BC|nr:RIP metalloprotease RseP [Salinibius halmophilus]